MSKLWLLFIVGCPQMCSFFSCPVSSVCSALTFLQQSLEACPRSSHTQLLTCLPQMAFHFLKGFYYSPFHPLSEKEVFLLFAKSTPPCIDWSTKDNHSHLLNLCLFILLYTPLGKIKFHPTAKEVTSMRCHPPPAQYSSVHSSPGWGLRDDWDLSIMLIKFKRLGPPSKTAQQNLEMQMNLSLTWKNGKLSVKLFNYIHCHQGPDFLLHNFICTNETQIRL